ncbi:MAG: enoyl-CoA hydratase/isomerase family protein [Ignavibacteria bacterium]|nr:MAG: enoyl-CoA hydratase/isomerase family protein [Ignavibacteria bacterium]
MNYTSILLSTRGRVTTISLNRPDRRNALNDVMISELTDAFGTANRDHQIRVVILTGEGLSFCAGMDLEYLRRTSELGQAENLEDARNLMKLLESIHALKKPVAAMVNGPALGGGCGLAAACDFVFVPYLMKRMGESSAREFVLRGEILKAEAAKAKGLVSEVVDDGSLTSKVLEFAYQLARSTSGSSLMLTKELFSRYDEMDTRNAMEYAANLNALARKTDDFRRGIDAFLRKEDIDW